jgi:HD-GYP domain-containing protein (c-di-GMP phosphodiesterase class II)
MAAMYLQVRKSNLNLYRAVPLYYKANDGIFALYKPPGLTLSEMRIEQDLVPPQLFINKSDKLQGIREIQKALNNQLKEEIKSNNSEKVKQTILNIVEETFSEPRSGSLEGASETVNILVNENTKDIDVIKNLLSVVYKDYTTALHSINVMALVLAYASAKHCSITEKRILGLSALLHDVGKTKIDCELLTAPRKLNDKEFKNIQSHTSMGYAIINRCKFAYPEIKNTALQHHEKCDGSGYPNGVTHISETAQIVGLIDCYEALTNDDRPYRDAMVPFKALTLIKEEVLAGKLSRNVFREFIYSLI